MRRHTPLFLLLSLSLVACPEAADEPVVVEECDACDGDCVIEQFRVLSASHVEGPVDYSHLPPTGGDHNPCWAPYGPHVDEVPAENWVHNLEHGAIVYLYNCPDGCDEEVANVEALAGSMPEATTLVSPYSAMTAGFAAVSWGWRLKMSCADEDMLRSFYEDHQGQAPEATTAGPPEACM